MNNLHAADDPARLRRTARADAPMRRRSAWLATVFAASLCAIGCEREQWRFEDAPPSAAPDPPRQRLRGLEENAYAMGDGNPIAATSRRPTAAQGVRSTAARKLPSM